MRWTVAAPVGTRRIQAILDGCRLVGITDRLVELPGDCTAELMATTLTGLSADPEVAGTATSTECARASSRRRLAANSSTPSSSSLRGSWPYFGTQSQQLAPLTLRMHAGSSCRARKARGQLV